jgi:hypothetical protein
MKATKFPQVNEYIDKARNETLGSLYKKVTTICKKYIEADDFHMEEKEMPVLVDHST